MADYYSDKTVLITGGTGSFGKTFAKYLLESTAVGKVIIFSRDELKQWQMRESYPTFKDSRVRFFLGDVRDSERLHRAFQDVHIVIHAAALKQVPAAEYNPTEFVKTNVMGAMNITNAALNCGVEQVIALSTDKAVNPINLYGATKLCSDKLFIAANAYSGKRAFPQFSIVRYGNVLGSRGSLIPLWNELLAKGVSSLPVTDVEMTRFWISLEDAAHFVANRLRKMQGGEIYIPKSPSVKIVDLAKALQPKAAINIVGIRPGEKVHEVLISADEARHCLEGADFYCLMPQFEFKTRLAPQEALHKVSEGFILNSATNPLFTADIKKIEQFLEKSSRCMW